jgi:hypothetical protein
MGWTIKSVEQKPTKSLDAWMVVEVPFDGADRPWTRHLIGFRREGCKGQVSSPVESFDPATRRAVTRTGQVYELGPRPGVNADAFATWARWKSLNKITHERDITDEVAHLLGHGDH